MDGLENIVEETMDNDQLDIDNVDTEFSGNDEIELPLEEEEDDDQEYEETEGGFDPDSLSFDEDINVIDGYDLSKYAEILNFEDPENLELVKDEMQKLKAKGYTQREAEIFIEAKLEVMNEYDEDDDGIVPVPTTQVEVKQLLQERLTREEQANYKPIFNLLAKEAGALGLSQEGLKEAMARPGLIKMLNVFFKHGVAKGGVKTAEIKAPEPKVSVGFETAMGRIQNEIMKGTPRADIIKYGKQLEGSMKGNELAQFKSTFGRIFGLN